MFVKIQLRLLLIWGGGHRPLSVFSKRLLIMGQWDHPLSATGGVRFLKTKMYKRFVKKKQVRLFLRGGRGVVFANHNSQKGSSKSNSACC